MLATQFDRCEANILICADDATTPSYGRRKIRGVLKDEEKPFYRKVEDIPIAEREENRLKHLRIAIDMGCYRGLRWKLDRWCGFLAKSQNPDVLAELQAIEAKTNQMRDFEKINGAGVLLNLNHEVVRSVINRSDCPWSEEELARARRHKSKEITFSIQKSYFGDC